MKVSMQKVAEYCGVSIGTVDRVIHKRPGVNQETKIRVEKAIKALNYTTNHIAKSLSNGTTKSIGIILYNLRNMFFAELSDALVSRSHELGYFPYLTLSEQNPNQEFCCIKEMIARQIDGLIFFSTNRDPSIRDYLSSCGIPVVTIMTRLDGFPSVGIDDFAAVRDATNYIISKDYKRIIYISPPLSYKEQMNISTQEERLEGFIKAVESENIDYSIIDSSNYLDYISTINLVEIKTAFLCSSDIYAIRIMSRLRLKGLQTPYHYGIMGFDNIRMLEYIDPMISTVHVPIAEIGVSAVDSLIRGISIGTVESVVWPHSIIARQSIV